MTNVKTLTAACAALLFSSGAIAMSTAYNNSTNETSWLNVSAPTSQDGGADMQAQHDTGRDGFVNNTRYETAWLNQVTPSGQGPVNSTNRSERATSPTQSMGAAPASVGSARKGNVMSEGTAL